MIDLGLIITTNLNAIKLQDLFQIRIFRSYEKHNGISKQYPLKLTQHSNVTIISTHSSFYVNLLSKDSICIGMHIATEC